MPPIYTGKATRIPCGFNICPSNAFNTVGDETRVREPRDFQHTKDLMHVAAPSSRTVRKIFFLRQPMVSINGTKGGRHGSHLSESKEMRIVSKGSIPPIADNKSFRYRGQLCKISIADMAQGA